MATLLPKLEYLPLLTDAVP